MAAVRSAMLFVVTVAADDDGVLFAVFRGDCLADLDFTFGRKSDISDPDSDRAAEDAFFTFNIGGVLVGGFVVTDGVDRFGFIFFASELFLLLICRRALNEEMNSSAAGESPSKFFK